MVKKIQMISGRAGTIIFEYPTILLMALLSAISLICMNNQEYSSPSHFEYLKFSIISSLGISLMFALKMWAQRIGKALILQISGIVFLVLYYFLLPTKEKEFTEVHAFLLIPTFLLSHLLVAFLPFLARKTEINFWQYNKNLFTNAFLTVIFTGVLTGGVLLAILAIDHLFDFKFNSNYYSNTFYMLSIFGSCFIFLLFNEKGLQYLETQGDYPLILKFFTQYILIPLLITYAVILYFYSAKILINWELPRGWVSYLILAYSVVGILAILLVHPLKEDSKKSWVKIFSHIFYYTLAPLIILLFMAIFTRILEYGYTEPRYFVLLLSIWLASVVVYFILIKVPSIKFIPISLFFVGFFALAVPYFNAFSVATRSQKSELTKTLKENKLLNKGNINFSKSIKKDIANEIADKIQFLAKRKEENFILPFLSTKIQKELKDAIKDGNFYIVQNMVQNQFSNVLFEDSTDGRMVDLNNKTLIAKDFAAEISDYQYLFKAYNYKRNYFEFDKNTIEVNITANQVDQELNLIFNDQKVNLNSDLQLLFNQYPNPGDNIVDHLFIIKTIGNYDFKIMFDSIILLNNANQSPDFLINSESILILIKKN